MLSTSTPSVDISPCRSKLARTRAIMAAADSVRGRRLRSPADCGRTAAGLASPGSGGTGEAVAGPGAAEPQDAGDPPPAPGRARGHHAELCVGPPLLGHRLDPPCLAH